MAQTEVHMKKPPIRVLHFSDGTLEEYSSDEEDKKDEVDDKNKQVVDPVRNKLHNMSRYSYVKL